MEIKSSSKAVKIFKEEKKVCNVHVKGPQGSVCDAKVVEYPGKSIPPLYIASPLLSSITHWLDHQSFSHCPYEVASVVAIVIVLGRLTRVVRDWTGTRALQRSRAVLALVVPTLVEEEAAARDPDRQRMATGVGCEDFDTHGEEKGWLG